MSDSEYAFYHERLKDHVLEVICDHEKVKCFRLCPPDRSNCMSTYITFNPYGIMLNGDLTPGTKGNVSSCGYGVGWFSGHLSVGYLLEKFDLEKRWDSKEATEYFRRIISRDVLMDMYGDEEEVDGFIKILEEEYDNSLGYQDGKWQSEFETPEDYYDAMRTVFGDAWWDGYERQWYAEHEVGYLTAIQTAFAREYNKMEGVDDPEMVINRS